MRFLLLHTGFLALALLGTMGCSGSSSAVPSAPVPVRAPTSGLALLAKAPLGADLVLEIDLARLRQNPVVGPILEGLAAPTSQVRFDLLQRAEAAVLCIYNIGEYPRQLILLAMSEDPDTLGPDAGLHSLAPGLWGVGDSEYLRHAEALRPEDASMGSDEKVGRLRAKAMPEKAQNAAFRLVAQFDFDARVAIASKLGVSEVPVNIAIWGDVEDDLAIIVDMQSEDEAASPRLARAMEKLRTRLSRQLYVRYLGLSDALRKIRISQNDKGVRLVFVIGPKALRGIVQRLARILAQEPKQTPVTNDNETKKEEK